MKVLALSKTVFDKLMIEKKITPENVENESKLLFISINNNGGIVTEADRPFFPESKKNVKVMYFSDVEKNTIVPLIGQKPGVEFLAIAMTEQQAKELYGFIKDNIEGKEVVLIHCTMGVSRSGAVASFIHDYVKGDWETFKRNNNQIQSNAHVYTLLQKEWFKDTLMDKDLRYAIETDQDFKQEVWNPLTPEQEVALHNDRNPDHLTIYKELTLEQIKDQYPGADVSRIESNLPYSQVKFNNT